jgi:predicted permease
MHHAFLLWLAKRNRVRIAKFLQKKRNFDIFMVVVLIVLTALTTWLGWLLYKFLFIKSPCEGSTQPICTGIV